MPINSFNIDKMLRLIIDFDYVAITTSNSTICTSINKSACHIQVTSRGNLISSEVCHPHCICNTFEDNIHQSWRTAHFLCSVWDPIKLDIVTRRDLISQ